MEHRSVTHPTIAGRLARRIPVVALLFLLTAPCGCVAAAEDGEEVHLTLEGALWPAGKPEQAKPLELLLTRRGERWDSQVWGQSRAYNHSDHLGRIAASSADGGRPGGPAARVRLTVAISIERDKWTESDGLGEYAIEFVEEASGASPAKDEPAGGAPAKNEPAGGTPAAPDGRKVTGTWHGKLRDEEGHGAVRGTVLPLKYVRPGFRPLAPDEHPRLLIRREDIPALREKAQTEWGRQMAERLKGGMAGWALLYVLTGDAECAAKARAAIEKEFPRWRGIAAAHDPAVVVVESAIAFDLIYDACEPAFRAEMKARFAKWAPFLFQGGTATLFNPNDHSNWAAMYRSAVGMCALSLLGDPGEYPARPAEPELPRIEAPADLRVAEGVPVVKLEGGKLWSTWLFAGPFSVSAEEDALAPLGGAGVARPEPGTKVAVKTPPEKAGTGAAAERVFAPLDPKFLVVEADAARAKGSGTDGAVDLTAATGRVAPSTSYLYAVVENGRAGHFVVDSSTWGLDNPCVYLAGRRLVDGDRVYLGAGRFPVLVCAPVIRIGNWQKLSYALRLKPIAEAEAQAWLEKRRRYCQYALPAWEAGRQRYLENGKADPEAEHWLGVARQRIANWITGALGDHGWNMEGEAYTQHSYRLALPFAHSYRNVTGRDLTEQPNLSQALPLYAARTIFGDAGARMQGYGPGGGPLGVDNYARGFALVPEDLKPAVLWAWNRTQALADARKFTEPHGIIVDLDPLSAAFRFVNYPLDLKERNPGELLPHVVVEQKRGGYVFRNRWQDADDFVATTFLNSNFPGGGWWAFETGEFRISGLGVDWAVRGAGWGSGGSARTTDPRLYLNALHVAEPIGGGTEAWTTFFEARPDGSGVVSMNLDDVYTGASPGPKGGIKATPSRPGAHAGYDLGLRGMRSFAADYSGACGAPGLFVVADQISGSAGPNTWQLVTDKAHTVTVAGNTFTIRAQNGATLQATVVAPAAPAILTEDKALRHEFNYHGGHKSGEFARSIINVPGGEFFLVVLTIQKGAAPAVKVEGQGPEAKVKVGGRGVSFDGKKVVFE